jgi:hypothetical protein
MAREISLFNGKRKYFHKLFLPMKLDQHLKLIKPFSEIYIRFSVK